MGSQHVPAPMLSDLLTSLDLAASSRSAARPSTDPIETFPPPRVAIVGGSLGGCCAAIALRSVGCEVEVFERNRGVLRSQGAGLVIQEDMAAFLTNFQVCDVKQIAVPSAGRQYVDKTGKVIDGDDQPQLFSAWDAVYATLRQKVPDTFYHAGRVVESVAVEGDKVQIAIGGEEERLEFDMVIGADG